MTPPRKQEARLELRLSPAEKAAMQAAADARGLSLSAWLRMVSLDAAKKEAEMSNPFDWDKAFEEVAQETAAAFDKQNTPERIAQRQAKAKAEHERGVRLGWWDADGNPLNQDDSDTDDDDEQDEE